MYYHAYPRDWSKTRFSARAAEHVLSYMCNVQLSKLTRNAMTGYRTEGSATQSLTSNSFCSQRTYVVYVRLLNARAIMDRCHVTMTPKQDIAIIIIVPHRMWTPEGPFSIRRNNDYECQDPDLSKIHYDCNCTNRCSYKRPCPCSNIAS